MTLVVDASAAVAAAGVEGGFGDLSDDRLVAPHLMWSEASAALHSLMWRGALTEAEAVRYRDRIEASPIALTEPEGLRSRAWRLADELGWAKTYDAEYLALARILNCRVVTMDRRLRRGADRLGIVVGPEEL